MQGDKKGKERIFQKQQVRKEKIGSIFSVGSNVQKREAD